MALRTDETLKTFFETGDKPTQSEFGDLIDSKTNVSDLASTLEGFGASLVGLYDPLGLYNGTTLAEALQEIGTSATTGTAYATDPVYGTLTEGSGVDAATVTANTEALQAAINDAATQHKTLQLPPGIYKVNKLWFSYDGVSNPNYPSDAEEMGRFTIKGAASPAVNANYLNGTEAGTWLLSNETSDAGFYATDATPWPNRSIRFEDITFAGSTTDILCIFTGPFKWRFQNVRIYNNEDTGSGIKIDDFDQLIIDGMEITGSLTYDTGSRGFELVGTNIDSSGSYLHNILVRYFETGYYIGGDYDATPTDYMQYTIFDNLIANDTDVAMRCGDRQVTNIYRGCQLNGANYALQLCGRLQNITFQSCGFGLESASGVGCVLTGEGSSSVGRMNIGMSFLNCNFRNINDGQYGLIIQGASVGNMYNWLVMNCRFEKNAAASTSTAFRFTGASTPAGVRLLYNVSTCDTYMSSGGAGGVKGLARLEKYDDNGFTTLSANDTTPSVLGVHRLKTANSSGTTITDFDDGYSGQLICVEVNDSNTTLDFTGSSLTGNNGQDYLCSNGDTIFAVLDDTTWRCTISKVSTPDDVFVITGTAGENLSKYDLLYSKNASGTLKWYKYDCNGTDKAYPPRAMAYAAITADASGLLLMRGLVTNSGWSMTTNQDEGKLVYGSGTAGAITLTQPSTSGDYVSVVGYVQEENTIYFAPTLVTVEVP